MTEDTRPKWEVAAERHQQAERAPGRTPGPKVGDEFQDGHRLREYPISGSSGFITGHRVLCDPCAEAAGKSLSHGPSRHWTTPTSMCDGHDHEFNTSVSGIDRPSEYEQYKDDESVRGWDLTAPSGSTAHTMCPSCAEDRRAKGHDLSAYEPITDRQVSPGDGTLCDDCGHNLGKDRKTAMKTQAYGETKAPDQVDTLREENCPVCGESDAYDGDQCQVCGFVTPPAMFADPDLSKAKMMDLRADPASGDPNDQDPNVGQNLPPVDPDQVTDDGGIEGQEAGAPETQDDGDGIVDVETRGLGDEGMETGQPGQDDGVVDPEDLNGDGEVSPEEQQVAQEQSQVDDDAEEVKAAEDAEESGTVSAPVDPDAATGHVNQGGEPFTQGPNAPTPEEPVEPGSLEGQEADGQEDTGTNQVAGNPGDGIDDLLCPSCGFTSDAASPTSTPGSPAEPANDGDGMLAGDVCPQCQGATLMSPGEIQQMSGAPK